MSAFLGPIHYFLYSKIEFQNNLCEYLLEKAELKSPGFSKEINDNIKNIPVGELEDIVDLSNIHGSLQSMIYDVENRLVFIVEMIEKNSIYSFDEILEFAREYGRKIEVEEGINAMDAYTLLSSKLLNGMPCDRVQEILDKDDDFIVWRDRMDIHEDFWKNLGRNSRDFYEIRKNIIIGILEKTDLTFDEESDYQYSIRRK